MSDNALVQSSLTRKAFHLIVSRSEGDLCLPVYLHVEREYLEWFQDEETLVADEIKDRVAINIGEIEGFFYEYSPPPSKASLTPNYSISGLKRLGARSDIILNYAVRRRRRDDYSILLSDLQEKNLADFALYLWVKPSAAAMASYSHLAIDISSSRVRKGESLNP
jgi:hypothetical protein